MTDDEDVPLRLAVLDAEDLAVVSAHLQDAEASLGEMTYLPRQARFVLALARFDWVAATKGRFVRCQTGLHFERVLRVARSGLADADQGRTLRLLAISFLPGDAPSGTVLLTFVGGALIRLDVECLEAEMRDLGPRWSVKAKPEPDPLSTGAVRPAPATPALPR